MKKFITGIPMLPEGSLHRVSYETEAGETLLRSDIETRFPAMLMIDSSAEQKRYGQGPCFHKRQEDR